MLKLWGAVFIVIAFYAIGQRIAEAKRARLNFIENMLISLSDFKTAIEVFSLPLPKALEKSGINECRKAAMTLDEEDDKDFSVFIRGVKAETVDGQISNIVSYEKKLFKEEYDERQKYKKETKLIKGGFLLLGLLISIMLL